MSNRSKKQWLLIGSTILIILLILLAGWFFRESIQERIVEPTASRVWWWWNFAKILFPQTEIWVLLILLGALRLSWFAAGRTKLYFPDAPVPQKSGRVGHWLELLRLGHRAQRLFIKPLRFLTVDVFAETEREPREVIFSRLYRQTLPLPTHLQAYLNKGGDNSSARMKAMSDMENVLKPKTKVDLEIEEIIDELENLMEITHDA